MSTTAAKALKFTQAIDIVESTPKMQINSFFSCPWATCYKKDANRRKKLNKFTAVYSRLVQTEENNKELKWKKNGPAENQRFDDDDPLAAVVVNASCSLVA